MIHPVKKALNRAAREQYYGFLNQKQFKTQGKGYPDQGPEKSGQTAKPKSPLPTKPMQMAREVK